MTKKEDNDRIIKEIFNSTEENSYENITRDSSGRSFSRKTIKQNMDSRGQNTVKIKRFINGMVAQRQREIEDEIEEFLRNIQKGYEY